MRRKLVEGERFDRLEFLRQADEPRKAVFRCDCGVEKIFYSSNVVSGKARSCGCLRREETVSRSTKHGGAARGKHSRAYTCWENMVGRCTKPYREDYLRYGGRGIRVCEQWLDFEKFRADMGEPPIGMTLERMDNDGNYEPSNCRWATHEEQANNRRSNVVLIIEGRAQGTGAWAKESGVRPDVIAERLRRGENPSERLLRPIKTPRNLTHNGKTQTIREWAAELGVSVSGINKRLRAGKSTSNALTFKKPP